MLSDKIDRLSIVFDKIHKLNVCGKDPLRVKRDISKTNVDSKIMVIAEAMAPEQVRLSGVNYFYKDGTIGNTGRYLEKFLNLFNHSVYPEHPNCIYHTEIVHSFPGYVNKSGKRSIRRPTEKEIKESVESKILEQEIDIVNPKLILLMGNTAYMTFYKYFLNIKPKRNLTKEIEYVSATGDHMVYRDIPVIPIQHSSGANPRFSSMLKNEKLVELMTSII